MRHAKGYRRLNRTHEHRKALWANMAGSLIEHEQIKTTLPKAKELRPIVEKLVTLAKKGDLHNRREVLKTIRDKGVVHVLFTEIAPTFSERPGGYTRITKIGPRKGDNAPMAVIELVTEAYSPKAPKAAPAAPAAPAEEPVAEETEVEETEVEETEAPEAAEETEAPEAEATEESAEESDKA